MNHKLVNLKGKKIFISGDSRLTKKEIASGEIKEVENKVIAFRAIKKAQAIVKAAGVYDGSLIEVMFEDESIGETIVHTDELLSLLSKVNTVRHESDKSWFNIDPIHLMRTAGSTRLKFIDNKSFDELVKKEEVQSQEVKVKPSEVEVGNYYERYNSDLLYIGSVVAPNLFSDRLTNPSKMYIFLQDGHRLLALKSPDFKKLKVSDKPADVAQANEVFDILKDGGEPAYRFAFKQSIESESFIMLPRHLGALVACIEGMPQRKDECNLDLISKRVDMASTSNVYNKNDINKVLEKIKNREE